MLNTACPICEQKGRSVDGATVKSLLAISLRHVRNVVYRFCANPDCDVVYYSEDGEQTFTTDQIRVRVYQKEPEADDVLVCYCFQHTRGDVHQHVAQSTQATLIDDINAGIQAGQCACDWRNPQGNCCLGNVKQLMKSIESSST
ncbi:MAG: hypothetical protein CUN56_10580 [Phototrophicales bacterium]|nr:MAG: hypothetical protein CUN56_10580 [Phototrophicales bacterium]RMG71718.1 MAG: hypothetical protein D6711_14660 [Chloroflexota bacterium]